MWADTQDFNTGGGGFDISGYNSSPSTSAAATETDRRDNKRASSIVPVAIKQIVENNDDTMSIAGYPVSMLTIVGIVRSVEMTSTKIVYKIDDWSGSITGMQWLEQNPSGNTSNVVENTYCRMTGSKQFLEGKVQVLVFMITPVENLSELTFHFLQVLHIPLKAEELRSTNQDRMNNVSYGQNGMSGIPNSSASLPIGEGISLPPHQMKVYRVLQQCTNENGMHRSEIHEKLKRDMSSEEINKVLEFLNTEGHTYNTADDDHYKITDS